MRQKVINQLESLGSKIDTTITNKVSDILTDSFEESGFDDFDEDIQILTNAILCSYYELFDNDLDIDSSRSFGFKEIQTVVESLHEVKGVTNSGQGEVERVASNLLANLRNISIEQYVNENLIEEDIKIIATLLFPQEEVVSNVEQQILDNQAIQSAITRTVTSILSVYEEVMSGGFEIEQYFGVSTLSKDIGSIKVSNSKAKVYKSVALKGLADIIKRNYPVGIGNDRQFNMEKILQSSKPVYFPYKIAEYVFGRVSTKNLKSMDYAKFDGGSGWENYASNYIKPNLTYFLNKGVLLVVEQNGFIEDGNLVFQDEFNDIKVIKQALKKMEQSMVTMVVIPELESTSANYENWASVKIRLVDVAGNPPSNQKLMTSVIEELMDGLGNANGGDYLIGPETVEDLASYKVYEYEHTFDSKMANIRPLFAYQALDSLQAKGETVDWSNIILGKGINGRTVTSKEGGSINLSAQLIHNIIAGSRSGKGVMTLNILSTAIASNRPTFYIDRKPDMAALFAEYVGLSNNTPNMFIVNGSAYEGRFDPNNVLNYDVMSDKWKKRVPQWWEATSYKDIGDIVYYRGILFTLGLLLLRFWAESADRGLYEQLGGDRGVAIIYDEFTNWQNSFSTKKLNPRGSNSLFGKDMLLNKKNLEEITKAMDEIAELSGQELGSKQKSTLRNAESVIRDLKTEKRAYMSDLLENMDRTLMTLNEKKNAGFKNTEEKRSDIFVIGQNVEVKPLPEGITFSRNQASGGLNANAAYENTCAISNFLYNFSTDWFMGYNRDYKHYMRADVQASPSYVRLTEEARNFVYYNGSRDAVMGDMQISTIKSQAKFFKPYLILNNAKEPKPLSNNPEERKAQCQQAEYQYVGGVILNTGKEWDKIRQQNLQEGTDELRQEIGFFDYLGQLSRGVSNKSNPKESLAQSKQIADMIVAQMGYDGDYLDFLMDLRPEWNFSAQCIVDAFATPELFKQGAKRTPFYLKLFGGETKTESQEEEVLDLDFVDEDEKEIEETPTYMEDSFDSVEQEDDFSSNEGTESEYGDTDYYNGEPTVSATDVEGQIFDPFNQPVNPIGTPINTQVGAVPPITNPMDEVAEMSTDKLIEELANRGIDVTAVRSQRELESETYGNPNQVESFGRQVDVGQTGGMIPIAPIPKVTTEQAYYENYFDFCEKVTQDIIESFGGYSGVEVIVIKDGILYINNVKYNKKIPKESLVNLPIDKKQQVMNSNYAHIFNFAHLTKMSRLAYLSIDSKDFTYIKIRQDLHQDGRFDVIDLFRLVPPLFYLNIGGTRYQRDTVEEELARTSSIFRSQRKRQMVVDSAEQFGSKSVNSSWDSTKNMYQRKGWGWKLGGTAMLGVTAVAGAGYLGLKGIRGLAKEVKDLFKG